MFQSKVAAAPAQSGWQRHVVPEGWGRYTMRDHDTWNRLYDRQVALLEDRIVSPFFTGLKRLDMQAPMIPKLKMLSGRLDLISGWRLVPVAGIVPDADFFAMLSERVFPVGNFIRDGDQLDYLEEPDCFHDIFGHVPLLAYQPVARLMEALGRLGVAACASGHGETIARLYWHTVEFGLAEERGKTRILGAGLASSFGEAVHALEADVPRPRFEVEAAAATAYRSDCFQPLYFVSGSLEEATAALEGLTLAKLQALGS
ncbi:phenylalanine 4-monooxygenase [Sphingomicrobium nitratireducens]|uniref:phenylalanine 4-monooxygenase n=1 Tax=Sphingomicrobium nitratireducens TaxID=2964666 RepID=UPI00223F59AD|nr:phenylalanine 4-monooxygenase [Sphingomicrobium nitratireducens]